MKMPTLGFVFLVVLATTNADRVWKVMDTNTPQVKDKQCSGMCNTMMDVGLDGVKLAFNTLVRYVNFDAGFCQCVVTGLGNFTVSKTCFSNNDGTIFDYDIKFKFVKPTATCSCPLSNNPAEAAKKVMEKPTTGGNCGRDHAGDKMENKQIKCASDDSLPKAKKSIELEAAFEKIIMDYSLRVDTQTQHAFPTAIVYTTAQDNPIQLVGGQPDFQKAFECLNNKDNIDAFYRKLFFNAQKPIFDCLDDEDKYPRSLIDTIVYYAGNCNNYPTFG